MTGSVEFRLLGPVEAARDGLALPLGGRRQRALLALLLLEPGRPVAAGRLAEELWDGRPPPAAAATLRSYVSRLRTALGPGVPLTAGSAGYALAVAPEQVDVHRFEQLVRDGQEALSRRRAGQARGLFGAALRLWRERPFADLSDHGSLRIEAERFEEVRLLAVEGRIDADLALGRGADLVDELERLVAEHRYRERLWRSLMLALYRAGRQADALATYRRLRAILDEELGLEPGDELKRLEQAILRQEVPRVVPLERTHNLPAPTTAFIGREEELDEVERLLGEARLITLTGVGGVGKTRLALEVAARALPDFADGVVLCDLAPVADAALLARHIGAELQAGDHGDIATVSQLVDRLGDAELLLLLDNCEHLRTACAELMVTVLRSCPFVRVLATSREVLGAEGEVDYPVSPLALPRDGSGPSEARTSDAVRLFVARARASRATLPESEDVYASAARICRDLDGLPLAIELAAARVKALSLDEIADRLDDRFRFLVSWRRLAASRHRTLREAMDWSYELLAHAEQDLLARLSVFAGGFTLPAAAAVCLDGDEDRTLDTLERLVDGSLVVAEERHGAMRYRLLETVRQFAALKLQERSEELAARHRHAEWCLTLAEEAESHLTGEEQTRWFAILDAEADNFRSALAYARTEGEPDVRLRLAISLSRFWYVRGHLEEARHWLEQALGAGGPGTATLRRRALTAAAAVTLLQGDYPAATRFAEEALAVSRVTGDQLYVANSLSNLGAIVLAAGERERALALLEEAVPTAREAGDDRITALALNNLGDAALTVGDYERAEPLFEESLGLLQARGDTANVARSLFNLGAVAFQLGRLDDARARFRESMALADSAGDKEDLAWCLEGAAALAAAGGHGVRAGQLLGAAAALLEGIGATYKPFERQLHDASEALARAASGPEELAAAMQAGAELDLAEAVACARAELTTA